jgi:hypothetical protein
MALEGRAFKANAQKNRRRGLRLKVPKEEDENKEQMRLDAFACP